MAVNFHIIKNLAEPPIGKDQGPEGFLKFSLDKLQAEEEK